MTKTIKEVITEDVPVKVEKKKVISCSCSDDIGRNIRCPDHGDLDKI